MFLVRFYKKMKDRSKVLYLNEYLVILAPFVENIIISTLNNLGANQLTICTTLFLDFFEF